MTGRLSKYSYNSYKIVNPAKQFAKTSKLTRLLFHPISYLCAIYYLMACTGFINGHKKLAKKNRILINWVIRFLSYY